MAKFTPGPLAGQISGSVAGNCFSHNRYGPYIRNKTIPTISTTSYAMAAKNRMTSVSQQWQALTAAQQAAWNAWAQTNPVSDTLGNPQILTGHTCYVRINNRLVTMGIAPVTDPPLAAAPDALLTLTLSADIGAGGFDLAFTATPLDPADVLAVWACVLDSAGISYVKNRLRLVGFSGVAQISPWDPQTQIEVRFGTLIVGQTVVIEAQIWDSVTGQVSQRLRCQDVVESTV